MNTRVALLAAVAVAAMGAPALAFHDGGVAHCNGCHTMHNSQNNAAMNYATDGTLGGTPQGTGHPDLLLFANKTDVCLRCHQGGGSYHVWSTDPLAPGSANRGAGDFVFLEEDNINDAHAGADPLNWVGGYAAGHSVISDMMGTVVDPMNATSPGGNYDSNNLACSSCHDPHGTAAFRILYQAGQSVDNVDFTTTLEADGISLFGPGESASNHNAYQSGYSGWCATCHGAFHQASGVLVHPAGESIDSEIASNYNAYNGTQDCIDNPPTATQPCGSGLQGTAYLPEVPFVDAAMTTGSTAGVSTTGTSYVACVSCHRAHATSAMDAGRWDFNVTGLAEDGHESGSYAIPNPYNAFQRSLCNKCHSQDEFDAAVDFTP